MWHNFILVLVTYFLLVQPYVLHAKTHRFLAECKPNGSLKGKASPQCNPKESSCCEPNKRYPKYYCSPPVSSHTKATMTQNDFEKGGDGGDSSACDNRYHSDSTLIVALSTGWFNSGSRCGKKIRINGNGRSVLATVVDECDSRAGCDSDHGYQTPCANNVVDASDAVWKQLGYSKDDDDYGLAQITWSDA